MTHKKLRKFWSFFVWYVDPDEDAGIGRAPGGAARGRVERGRRRRPLPAEQVSASPPKLLARAKLLACDHTTLPSLRMLLCRHSNPFQNTYVIFCAICVIFAAGFFALATISRFYCKDVSSSRDCELSVLAPPPLADPKSLCRFRCAPATCRASAAHAHS